MQNELLGHMHNVIKMPQIFDHVNDYMKFKDLWFIYWSLFCFDNEPEDMYREEQQGFLLLAHGVVQPSLSGVRSHQTASLITTQRSNKIASHSSQITPHSLK